MPGLTTLDFVIGLFDKFLSPFDSAIENFAVQALAVLACGVLLVIVTRVVWRFLINHAPVILPLSLVANGVLAYMKWGVR